MKKKVVLTIVFIISLLPMLLNQYGGARGVQEITGLINLLNPIGIVSVMLFVVGVWIPFPMKLIGKVLCASSVFGIVLSEIYKFFTWHVQTITGEISLRSSIRLAFPEFYFGLIVSITMVLVYFLVDGNMDEEQSFVDCVKEV